jgi:hypothetical protein
MDTASMLIAMRDPAGVPGSPVLFEALLVVSWVAHIAFVLLTLGASALAIAAFLLRERDPHWMALSSAMTSVAKIGVSMLIVLGVAPLLFTQVIYDPQWYASNVLSASWAIGFIASLIVGYCLWFAFYSNCSPTARKSVIVLAVGASAIFLFDGLIMHALTYQSLLPERWMEWYAPDGVVDTTGAKIHAVQWSRFLFIISLSAPAIGLFLTAYSDYFASRRDIDALYLSFTRRLGRKIAIVGLLASLPLLLWWLRDLSPLRSATSHPVAWLLVAALLVLLWTAMNVKPAGRGYALVGAGVVVLLLVSLWREIVRIAYLAPFGYTIDDYKTNIDWPSAILFATTLLGVGGLVGGFYLTLAYRAGQTSGVYTASPSVARIGVAAVSVLVLWLAIFFTYGAAIFVRNAFLP